MAIPVVHLSFEKNVPKDNYWDMAFLEDIFDGKVWTSGYEFERKDSLAGLDGAVIVFPARHQTMKASELHRAIEPLKWVILILTGDEESSFPIEEISHPNMKVWVMSPKFPRHENFTSIGSGYPPHMRELMPDEAPEKTMDWFFGGQITHKRRIDCGQALENLPNGEYHPSKGFTQGLEPQEYFYKLSSARVAPCPSGPATPDSFRLFEALESGCVPVADVRTPKDHLTDNYWDLFFGETPPFPTIHDYVDLPAIIAKTASEYPIINNRVFAWWIGQKRKLVKRLDFQIEKLSGIPPSKDNITILMPSSPIPSHPSTKDIERCVDDVRAQLPDTEIFLMIDGVRREQERKTKDYEEYQRRLLWLCNYKWKNVLPLRFETHRHQSGMTKEALKIVETPMILFVEHDAPVVPDIPIPWKELEDNILDGTANVIRLHHEAGVHPEHEHMMIGEVKEVNGVKMRKTYQWSQRPHLASTAFYRQMMDAHFVERARAFIEHGVYGALVKDYQKEKRMGWNLWKVWMYHPDGQIKRSYHINSREDDPIYRSIL